MRGPPAFASACLLLLQCVPPCSAFTFLSSPAADLQPLFNVAGGPWLGADVATSVSLSPTRYLWLHGDTLVGRMSGGVRVPTAMPRNSVALLDVSADGRGTPAGPLRHFVKTNASDPVHFGFFSPANASEWYWPTVGLALPGLGDGVLVLAMRMFNAGGGLFPFAMAGMDVLALNASGGDPLAWPAPALVSTTARFQRDNFTLGCAAAYDAAAGFVYVLGAAGAQQSAVAARLPAAALAAGDWAPLEFWMPGGAWAAAPADGSPPAAQALFPFVPSETTLVWHPHMQRWYVVVANTFIYGADIVLRTAPAVTGPWSDEITVYTVPPAMLAGGVFCYAGKAHPELSPAGAPELVFSFMCNTQGIPPLLNRTDIYVPQLVRVAILG